METLRLENQVAPQSKDTLINPGTAIPRSLYVDVGKMSLEATTESTDTAATLVPDIFFTSVEEICSRIQTVEGDALVVGNISATDFRALEQARDAGMLKIRLFYLPDAGCLIITIPTSEHDEIHTTIGNEFINQMGNMGVLEDWRGTTTGTGPGGSSGQGDTGGHPRSKRRHGEWPTLVIESGYTQTMASLNAKMRWWFSASSHDVKVVILAKMVRSEIRLHIEKWQEVIPRPGATTTRWATRAGLITPQPRCLQAIDVCWDRQMPFHQASQAVRDDLRSFRVSGGPLTIDFALVFLRAPGISEHDFVVSDHMLRVLAASTMQRQ